MCRITAYFGQTPILLKEIIDDPDNSLIKQSRKPYLGNMTVNGDGFGIGWFADKSDPFPGIFKSTQPAWNDQNLTHLIRKISSPCFVGHIRASTVGDVTWSNCHPFFYNEWIFAHNGHIESFLKIKREILKSLKEPLFEKVKGQTDSEHFFFLIMNEIAKLKGEATAHDIEQAIQKAIQNIAAMQKKALGKPAFRINGVLTNGKIAVAMRLHVPARKTATKIYYRTDPYGGISADESKSVIISSEPLEKKKFEEHWNEIPLNNLLIVHTDYSLEKKTIKVR